MLVTSKIVKIATVVKLLPLFESLTPNTLVLWDFNNTLLMHQDRIMRVQEVPESPFNGLKTDLARRCKKAELNPKELLSTALAKKGAFIPIEPGITEALAILSQNQIPTSVLTSCTVGRYGAVPDLHLVLLDHLRANNISFKGFLPAMDPVSLEMTEGPPALFLDGIIFNNNHPKHLVLEAFLKAAKRLTGWTPDEVIMIDDILAHLEGIQVHMEQLGIPFRGFHYTRVEETTDLDDVDLFRRQFARLLKTQMWPFERDLLEDLPT